NVGPRCPGHKGISLSGLPPPASVLGSCLQPAPAQTPVSIVLTPPSPVAGGGVSLAPEPATQGILTCNWYRSATTDENSRILTYIPGPPPVQSNGPNHTGRETAGPGCALTIAGLTLSDTGSYTVRIESPTNPGLGSLPLPHPRPSDGALGVSSGMNRTQESWLPAPPRPPRRDGDL
uniref:Immunoglobulin V-set domain-containing protein n=1 Tax=Chelydra serpentina TaxID=8475 RepID=A0A8C3SZX7_CHESE